VAGLERFRPQAAALALWAGVLLVVGTLLPWLTFASVSKGVSVDWTGTQILWGVLPFVAGWVLAVHASSHVRAKTVPSRRIVGTAVILAAIALVGASVVGVPRTEAQGLAFQSIQVGFLVEIAGILLGGLAFRMGRTLSS
jgi:hypothetical protein